MTLPGSMDYLSAGGVLNFDAAAYLNNPNARQMPFKNPLNASSAIGQPTKDTFMSKTKGKLKQKDTWKKIAAGAIVATLAGIGIYKGTKGIQNISSKASNLYQQASTKTTGFFQNLIAKFKK